MVGSNIPFCPILTLLGDTSRLDLPRNAKMFLFAAFLMAKKMYIVKLAKYAGTIHKCMAISACRPFKYGKK